jgi:polar amino acid transport system substrate-binding protein
MTVATDNPAFPPYFLHRDGGNTAPWQDEVYTGDPTTGKGLESAVAYEVAKRLGFEAADVVWTPLVWSQSFAPGDKPFDFYIGQISFQPERTTGADLSEGYFDLNQSVVGNAGTPIVDAKTIADLAGYKLAAAATTTGYDYLVEQIKPTQEPAVYDTVDALIKALDAKQIDGYVVDLPTAFINVSSQLKNGAIVGVLPTVGEVEHFSIVLDKDSALTSCVNQALAAMKADGTLKTITDTYLTNAGAKALT